MVDKSFIVNQDTYNIRTGGYGGDGGQECNRKISKALKGKYPYQLHTNIARQKRIKTLYKKYGKDAFVTFKGRKHSNETIQKIKDSSKNKHVEKLNSQFGTCWIYSNIEKKNKKIKLNKLKLWLNSG